MEQFFEISGQELEWIQPQWHEPRYELRAGDRLLSILQIRNSFIKTWQGTATATQAGWTFEPSGFFRPRVTAQNTTGGESIATVQMDGPLDTTGKLELADGSQLSVKTNLWGSEFDFLTEANEPVMSLRRVGGLFGNKTLVKVNGQQAAVSRVMEPQKLLFLVCLGHYLATIAQSSLISALIVGMIAAIVAIL